MHNAYKHFSYSAYLKALLFLLTVPLTGALNAQTTLAPGDAVFTLINMEGNNDDAFGFVLLSAVEAGTQISVTDKEYTTGTGFEAAEGYLTITFTTAFPCGTEVIITDMDPDPPVYAFGTTTPGITVSDNTDQGFQLSSAGETLVMYQGDNHVSPCSTCFVTALANTGVGFGVATTGSGDLPPGLVEGQSAMAMTANPDGDEWDNIKYNCSLTQEAPGALRPALLTPANWLVDNDAPLPTIACSPAFACEAVCAPVITGVELVDCSEGPLGQVTLLETVDVTDINATEFKIYPNPTTGNVQLPQLDLERLEIYDLTGRLVLTQQQPGNNVDLTDHPAGLYLLKMYAGNEVYSAKIVKE